MSGIMWQNDRLMSNSKAVKSLPGLRDTSTKIRFVSLPVLDFDMKSSLCQSSIVSLHGKPFVGPQIAWVVTPSAESMLPSLNAPFLRAAR
jgi:hypothetical protein